MTIAHAITIRRAELGMGRPELAKQAGISYPYLSEIENGVKEPSLRVLRMIAEALSLDVRQLLVGPEITWIAA